MSSLPFWIAVKPTKKNRLPNRIKYPLARKFMSHDGSFMGECELTKGDIPYLEGLRDAGNEDIKKGAKELIQAIEKWGNVIFFIE